MTARDEILGRVSAALRTARIPDEPLPPAVESSLEAAPPEQWRARFIAELHALNVAVHEELSAESVRARVTALLAGRSTLAWPDAALPYDLARALAAGPRVALTASRAAQALAEVGVTGVDAAIAETGTLALVSSADHPRTASLLPPVHLAIVRTADLVPTLRTCFARLRDRIPSASAINFITGPSRTADIELQLTLGVHGPGELLVVLGP